MTLSELTTNFAACDPRFAAALDAHVVDYGNADALPTILFGSFAEVIVTAWDTLQDKTKTDVFALIETGMSPDDDQRRTIVATGLVEGIQNIASHRDMSLAPIYDRMGPETLCFAQAIDGFWGIPSTTSDTSD
jgi:hypothetical protein